MVGANEDAARVQPFGNLLGVPHRQRVDDAGAREFVDVFREPGETLGLRRQAHRLQMQGVAHQVTALDGQLAELALHVVDDAVVGRRRGADDRQVRGIRRRTLASRR